MKILTLLALLCGGVFAQDFSGDWQGKLQTPRQGELRIVVHIAKGNDGSWNATMYSIDQGPSGLPASSVSIDGSNLKLAIEGIGSYEGKLNTAGSLISGTWTQGRSMNLDLDRATKETAWTIDPSPHTIQFITTDKDVKLEVLDWGGSGRPLLLSAGLGATAHAFDKFALKLNAGYHVYGVTRRGFGASSVPSPDSASYSADRLGDDIVAVIDALKLKDPVLVGHSIAGEELSSVGSRHPGKVAGLVYLDAAYPYAYWSKPGEMPVHEGAEHPTNAAQAIMAGRQKYTKIPVRILAIYALPHDLGPTFMKDNPEGRAKAEAEDLASTGAQADAFEKGVPSARVVRLAHANHAVFLSNEGDVVREMNTFLASLP
jgi:pimeloyl-ACP methyl ester carboxylesterase